MTDLLCRDERRRRSIRERRPHNGIDYVDVHDSHLCVHFLAGVPEIFVKNEKGEPPDFDEQQVLLRHIVIRGGRRVTKIKALAFDAQATADPFDEDCLGIDLDHAGDWSMYTLCFVELDEQGQPTDRPMKGLDPRYACIDFSFKIDCAAEIDCKPDDACPPSTAPPHSPNYLAKDYATFRQLILDRLSLVMPEWRERHIPDVGITIVELLAYAGDYLSYYQDAVATEAYLDTARHRISVRRHVRLVDYAMHEGCNARVFVHVRAKADTELDPDDFYFLTRPSGGESEVSLREEDLPLLQRGWLVFEPLTGGEKVRLRRAHNQIAIYTWGNEECCIAKGATEATLVNDPKLDLRAGDFLLFEELGCAGTASNENFDGTTPLPDADPTHRHVVRLTAVRETSDPLFDDRPLLDVEWSGEDAMPFALCVSAIGAAPQCDLVEGLAVVRGNVVLADHGRRINGEVLPPVLEEPQDEVCEGEDQLSEVARIARRYRPIVREAPLTFAQPLLAGASAARTLGQDPRAALPAIRLAAIPPTFRGDASMFRPEALRDPRSLAEQLAKPNDPALISLRNRLRPAVVQLLDAKKADDPDLLAALRDNLYALLENWAARADLLDSSRDDAEFVAEIDDAGRAILRFGNGEHGRAVDPGTTFLATYRAGNGRAGLIGAETIAHVVYRNGFSNAILAVRNPLAAAGAFDPEPVAEVRMIAPQAYKRDLQRAIIAQDYASLAQYSRFPDRNPAVQSAAANLSWTGSWYEADVAADPLGTESFGADLEASISGSLRRVRRMGHDLRVGAASYVPLHVQLTLCVDPRYLRAHVVAAVKAELSSGSLHDGRRGFFHPDRLTFGTAVYGSELIALVQNIEGVAEVHLDRLERLDARTVDVPPPSPTDPGPPTVYAPVLQLRPTEIPRLDNDPVTPENGILRILARGGR